ncbi:hypothetical protein BDZ89DRAFT_1018629 [Hymenopellis radicata]|nr:hypothetical protein BDZ89DRAFT_1018629 [Hymenopellis radicata]
MPPNHGYLQGAASTRVCCRRGHTVPLLTGLCSADSFFEDNLPKIVVIGGQSAGKSSLVEAVSGITVPRDSGTCTRCPMECTMSSDASTWSCTINLRIEFGSDGQQIETLNPIVPFATVTNKDDVEIYLRGAQAAILSPQPATFFPKKTAAELKALAADDGVLPFSRNTIEVEVKSPDLTDLVFVDLLGLIHNADDEEVELIKDLVKDKIKNDKTIILVTIPMSEDMEAQQAVKFARLADPEGNRTIGVLTKPDMLSSGASGARERWKKALLGQGDVLKHGYFCVRLPDDEERKKKLSPEVLARNFFDKTVPWNEIPDRKRFGIRGLVEFMSRLLVDLVEQNIPQMKIQVDTLIAKYRAELDTLGPAPIIADASKDIYGRIVMFSGALQKAIDGLADRTMVQGYRLECKTLKEAVLKTAPIFYPESRDPAVYTRTSEYELDVQDVKEAIRRNNTWELPGEVSLDATRDLISGFTKNWAYPTTLCFDAVFDNSLRHVLCLVERHFGKFKPLEVHVRTIVTDEMEAIKEGASGILKKIVELETTRVYSGNPDFLRERDQWLRRFRHLVYAAVARPYSPPPTPYEDELHIMAKVRAYFEVAYKRFIDHAALTMENELHGGLAEKLSAALINSLSASGRAEEVMKEDVDVVKRRRCLQDWLGRLSEIRVQLHSSIA